MKRRRYDEAVRQVLKRDPRYAYEAYLFLRGALDYTVRSLQKPSQGPAKHVSGRELSEGIRRYALNEFGPIARTVLAAWGVTRTEDFGDMVFNLVNQGVLGKTENDRKEDFAAVYDFHDAFTVPFLPAAARASSAAPPPPPHSPQGNPAEQRP
jgi:uncharacterized repeat protein (TIGR04138 family)